MLDRPLLLLLCLLSTLAVAPLQAQLEIDPSRYPESEVIWLQAEQGQQSLALLKTAQRPISRGTAVIVPDLGKHVAAPSVVPAQRQYLPVYGLTTLAVNPPDWPTENTEKGWQDAEQQLVAGLQAALLKADEYPGPKLLVTEGSSAALLGKALSEETLSETGLKVIILISPYLPEPKLNRQSADWLSQIFLPYLDVVSHFDNRWAKQADKWRQETTKSQFLPHYRRVQLRLRLSEKQEQDQLSRLIHGWMRNAGW